MQWRPGQHTKLFNLKKLKFIEQVKLIHNIINKFSKSYTTTTYGNTIHDHRLKTWDKFKSWTQKNKENRKFSIHSAIEEFNKIPITIIKYKQNIIAFTKWVFFYYNCYVF